MQERRILELLSKKYPNEFAAAAEIINLNAILALPKGTEYFLSDLHGEYDAFAHMIKSASGVIRSKIDEAFKDELSTEERDELAALIYEPRIEMERQKNLLSEKELKEWYYKSIYNMVIVCRAVSTKYTRSKARKRLPKYWDYSMSELLHADGETNRLQYYNEIIKSILDVGVEEPYIEKIARVITKLAVDKLYIIGDIYDRGPHPDYIMDFLMNHHDVDIQWGNHDILWIGAAAGNKACIANLLRINISYRNIDMIEVGYGINLRPLAIFAEKVYKDDPCTFFYPKGIDENAYGGLEDELAAKMHKAIAICQFKLEGQIIKNNPEFKLENRLSLEKIDYENGIIEIKGEKYTLRDKNFPTVDPMDPFKMTKEETDLLEALSVSILNSEKLKRHIDFLFSSGAMYKIANGNLLFHGCVPFTEDGDFDYYEADGEMYKGKALFDYLDKQVRKAYFNFSSQKERETAADLIWYLWLGPKSPFFGKDQMTTFERCFIDDKSTHKEITAPYYKHIDKKETCQKILKEFGLPIDGSSVILNGHVPVKIKEGESPVRAEGLRFIIDGGISKAYQKTTGIAGYTLIFNSFHMALVEHKPYTGMNEDGSCTFHRPNMTIVKTLVNQLKIKDSDTGIPLKNEVEELKKLIEAFRSGKIPEVY